MKLDSFMISYPHLICSDYGESEFSTFRVICPGLSSAKLGKILNYASRLLDDKEIYLEIGTFTGFSLISASHQNSFSHFVGIDNFSIAGIDTDPKQRQWVKDRLNINLDHWAHPNRQVIDGDFREINLEEGTKIGVFYIDGKHTYDELIENFKWGEKYLADQALIVIDDITIPGIGEGIRDWIKDKPEYNEFFRMHTYHTARAIDHWNPTFWNGLSMIGYTRKK